MDASDRPRFRDTLIGMGEVYGKEISIAVAEIYFDDLKEFALEDVLRAFTAHRKDPDRGRYFPRVADLIHKLAVTHDQAALMAWAQLTPLLRDSANAVSPDPITERVVQDLGGWTRLAHTDQDKLVWVEKEFVKRYQIYAEHGTDTARLLERRQGLRLIGGGKE